MSTDLRTDLVGLLNSELSGAVQTAGEALVQVRAGRHGAGSGIVWRSDGLIVTNAHVARRRLLRVDLQDGRALEGRVVAADAELDVAVLAVDATGFPAVETGDARTLKPGELVFAHGHPWGVPGAVSSGVVIGVGNDWPGLVDDASGREWLVVNMRLRPGNSGGPILDSRGRIVGISTIMAGPHVGMAVPAHVADALVVRSPDAQAVPV